MVLHTLSAAPDSAAFRDCLNAVTGNDAILLLGDGVYAALPASPHLAELLDSGAELYLLDTDGRAAGVKHTDESVTSIDMDGFVGLTESHPRQMAWF